MDLSVFEKNIKKYSEAVKNFKETTRKSFIARSMISVILVLVGFSLLLFNVQELLCLPVLGGLLFLHYLTFSFSSILLYKSLDSRKDVYWFMEWFGLRLLSMTEKQKEVYEGYAQISRDVFMDIRIYEKIEKQLYYTSNFAFIVLFFKCVVQAYGTSL